ncbi:MAG TPA: GNAT family N-acetyltransferase [Actinomycetes bacterium]|nr:GNAT family N-acetyltransferase [Actinomycetes bacterium]
MGLSVTNVPELNRFEARDGDELAGVAEYIRTDAGLIVFTHTEVDVAAEGKGVGSALAQHALEFARSHDLQVLPICPFMAGWIARHSDYADLLYRAKPSQVTD